MNTNELILVLWEKTLQYGMAGVSFMLILMKMWHFKNHVCIRIDPKDHETYLEVYRRIHTFEIKNNKVTRFPGGKT